MSSLIFLNPWILAGLLALPVLYFLLRITPPAPKIIRLPTARFLEGLRPDTQTPSKTPWWILLLRLLIAGLIIIALARPVYNPSSALPGSGAIRLVIDNSWAAAHIWDTQMRTAEDILARADREKREVYMQTTATTPGTQEAAYFGPFTGGQALSTLKGLSPYPWPADYEALAAQLKERRLERDIHSLWLSHGLDEGGFGALADELVVQGGLQVISPGDTQLPLILKPSDVQNEKVQITLDAPKSIADNLPVSVQILGENGRLLDQQNTTITPASLPATISFDIPEILRSEMSQFKLSGQHGAGGVYLLDARYKTRSVGIVGPADEESQKPFIEASYYLTRALEPFADLNTGNITEVLNRNPSTIILPDVGAMPAETLNELEDWIEDGGLLLRFAGPNMTRNAQNHLVPTNLRPGARATEGTLSWEKAPKLAPFGENSPFFGLPLYEDILVRQQILPAAEQDQETKIWAALDDGTPLITARQHNKGLLVMVHTSASPDWSDLALSGTYVEMLKRLVSLSGQSADEVQAADGMLQPVWVLDGFGARQSPDSTARAIAAADFAETAPGPQHPPGLYGRGGVQAALNLGDHIGALKTATDIPLSAGQRFYNAEYEQDLMPYLLLAALVLLLCDWLIMIVLISGLRGWSRFAVVMAAFFIIMPNAAHAADADMKYAEGLYLAYIKTGNPSVDATSQQGLENLSNVLSRRTSAEPLGVVALNPERDTLVFFPLIYWPISETLQTLSAAALQNIQSYLDHGGTILFDTRDGRGGTPALGQTRNAQNLREMIAGLNIPPLSPMDENHVLTRTFYLLKDFPGAYNGGTIWVEGNSANGRDGVSSVIVGAHDWASAWALQGGQRSNLSGGSQQQEMAYRTGVNFMLYALTGNYKADQVHVPYILERLGQ